MTARKPAPFDWGAWVRSFGVWAIGIVGALVAFYFTTNATLKQHEVQFAEVAKKFDQFNATLAHNYEDYAKNQKAEAEARDKVRDQLMGLFNQLGTNSAATNATVNAIGKQLDAVTSKLDVIQTRQQENKQLLQADSPAPRRR